MKSLLSLFLILTCINLNAQRGNLLMSRWHLNDKSAQADFQLLKKAGLYYFISNDNDNIYIRLRFADPKIQDKILKDGLTIWINMDDNQATRMGVRYPMGSLNQEINKKHDSGEKKEAVDDSDISLANTIELIGFISEQERHFPAENPDNFTGSVKYDENGVLLYRMVMPIAKLPVRNSRDGNGAMPFSLGFQYGFIPSSSSIHSSGGHKGSSDLYWINNVKLATSK
jgi:hypothetical protein